MKKYKLKAFCKANLSLRILKKNNDDYHTIQSFVSFCDLYDEIFLSKNNKKKDKISFYGKFKTGINANKNTITKTLHLLRKEKILVNKNFTIKIKKNIPHSSGLGGGSANAASLLSFFLKKKDLNVKKSRLYKIARLIGEDVALSLENKTLYLTGKKIKILKLRERLNLLIIFPNILCLTKKIYSRNRKFSLSNPLPSDVLVKKNKLIFFLINEHNDLEKTVIQMYPKVANLLKNISIQKGCYFSRLTGSGSACIGLFSNIKTALNAKKIIKKKFPNYWCSVSQTV